MSMQVRLMPFRLMMVAIVFGAAAPAWAAPPQEPSAPLLNVDIVDRTGRSFSLAGFHRVSADHQFRGYLGAAHINVPYARLRGLRVRSPERPGARMRAALTLRSGKVIDATFDEREAGQLHVGFAWFGRVHVFFRDIGSLKITGKTARKDLPVYGKPVPGVDVALTDRAGVFTELVRFRRAAGEDALPGALGAFRIAVPLRLIRHAVIRRDESPGRDVVMTARDGKTLRFRIPTYEEDAMFVGAAEFGTLRIALGKMRRLDVHGVTPELRNLDPLAAAGVKRDAQKPSKQ